jgi:hypothetical protein
MEATPYSPEMAAEWDAVVAASPGGTVLHSRRFLDYHGTRFRDLSFVGIRAGERALAAIFPVAADRSDPELAVSHPGISFGGVVGLSREPVPHRAFLRACAVQLREQGFRRLLYRMTPAPLLRQPDDGMLATLMRLGHVTRLDLWSVLRLEDHLPKRSYWRTEIRKAGRKGLRADPVVTPQDWDTLHTVISGRLARKYAKVIVHSVAELIDLHARLGPQSRGLLIRGPGDAVLAAMWFIDYGTGTLHNQYIGATDEGLALRASTFGLSVALEGACIEGFRQFSFGRSTLEDGFSENDDLVRFKSRFGAGLASQFHFEVALDRLVESGL